MRTHNQRRRLLGAGLTGLAAATCASTAALLAMPGRAAAQATPAPPGEPGTAGAAPRIVASFSILADITRELAPAHAEVTALVGPDADAHVFEPTPSAARRLAQADLVVTNGLGFEGWIERLIRISGYKGPVVVASAGITPRKAGRGLDPHAWQDLAHTKKYVARIADALAQRWPAEQAQAEQRRQQYLQRITALDQRVRQQLDRVPRAQRRVVTSHDAFGYFADAYGVDFFAPQGWNTDSEPSAAAVARLIRQIREQDVRAVFIENISNPRLIQRIAEEAGAKVGGRLFSDALSAPGGPADTYLKMFEHNAGSLVQAMVAGR
jgi:zinc/manganese transport system substrate-binding protein